MQFGRVTRCSQEGDTMICHMSRGLLSLLELNWYSGIIWFLQAIVGLDDYFSKIGSIILPILTALFVEYINVDFLCHPWWIINQFTFTGGYDFPKPENVFKQTKNWIIFGTWKVGNFFQILPKCLVENWRSDFFISSFRLGFFFL